MNSDASGSCFTANTSNGSVTVEINTDYGPITFSCFPKAVEDGIANLVADILQETERSANIKVRGLESLNLPNKLVSGNAEIYDERSRKVFPNDAIEQFSPGSRAYSQGTLEQFTENLKPAIILMLDHLAVTALVLGRTDLKNDQSKEEVDERRMVLLSLIRDHFGRSIQDLWN